MNRVFKVRMTHPRTGSYVEASLSFEVVAPTAEKAIVKARTQARREDVWRGQWVVEEVLHRGAAV